MATFYIICKYLQLGFGIYRSVVAKQDVVILLKRIGLLGYGMDVHLPVENRPGPVCQDPFIQLITIAVGLLVLHQRVVVYQLIAISEVKTIHV